jgi:hypothetical protein
MIIIIGKTGFFVISFLIILCQIFVDRPWISPYNCSTQQRLQPSAQDRTWRSWSHPVFMSPVTWSPRNGPSFYRYQ